VEIGIRLTLISIVSKDETGTVKDIKINDKFSKENLKKVDVA
jgi:hypothetical protein